MNEALGVLGISFQQEGCRGIETGNNVSHLWKTPWTTTLMEVNIEMNMSRNYTNDETITVTSLLNDRTQ